MAKPSKSRPVAAGKLKAKDKDPELVAFGAALRARRQAAGLTQEALADAAGLHWTYIGQIERGTRNLTYKNILRLAHGLGVPPGELFEGMG
jgi:transcriptional regulator with XRE-family HTH domain